MTRHRWILWCGMLLAWAAGDVGVRHVQAAQPQQRWALLIGIDDYTHAKDLKYCVADQQALKDSLVRSGFDERQVTLLRDKASDAKYLPFKSNIEKQITLLCDLAERGDFVVISFSGHGVHSGKTSYLCPADAKLDDQDSLISLDWIYERLQKSKADLKVVIVDACRNVPPELGSTRSLTGAELKDGSRAFVQATERLPDGLILLNSCSEGEFSQEDEQFGHGVFTHFLLEGLQGKADENKNGKVTLGELTSFASRVA